MKTKRRKRRRRESVLVAGDVKREWGRCVKDGEGERGEWEMKWDERSPRRGGGD